MKNDFANSNRAITREGISLTQSGNTYTCKPAREGVQKVVIFFTDGNPNHGNTDQGAPLDFNGETAKSTLEKATELKNDGVTIYSVAVIDGASSTDLTLNTNIYLQGVSSNYTNVTVTSAVDDANKSGLQTPEASGAWVVDPSSWTASEDQSHYLVVGEEGRTISDAFKEIATKITTGGSGSTTTTGRDGNTSVLITDYLGDYMEFKGIDGILYGVTADTTEFYAPGMG